jgi:hypothetical protein
MNYRNAYIAIIFLAMTTILNAEGLLGHWKLDEQGISKGITDESGNGLNGKASPTLIVGSEGRKQGDKAVKFDGKSYVNLGEPKALTSLTDNFTIEAWIKPSDVSDTHRVVSASQPDGYGFGIKDGELIFTFFGVFDHVSSGANIKAGEWCHISVVVNTSNSTSPVMLYKDGDLVSMQTHVDANPGKESSTPICIGNDSNISEGFLGLISDVSIFSKALTSATIKKRFKESVKKQINSI